MASPRRIRVPDDSTFGTPPTSKSSSSSSSSSSPIMSVDTTPKPAPSPGWTCLTPSVGSPNAPFTPRAVVKKDRKHEEVMFAESISEQTPRRARAARGGVSKSDSTTDFIMSVLTSGNVMFAALGPADLAAVVAAMEPRAVQPNTVLIREGDDADEFFVLESGSVEVTQKGTKINECHRGSLMGELALVHNEPRSATVTTTSTCVLWSMRSVVFRRIVADAMTSTIRTAAMELARVPLLANLSPDQLQAIAAVSTRRKFGEGDVLINKGDMGDSLFVVHSGRVLCTDIGSGGVPDVELGVGQYFGERALLTGERRAATVVAITDVSCTTIEKEAFDALLGSLHDVMARQVLNVTIPSMPTLKKLPKAIQRAVGDRFTIMTVEAGTVITRRNDVCHKLYVVKSGSLSVTTSNFFPGKAMPEEDGEATTPKVSRKRRTSVEMLSQAPSHSFTPPKKKTPRDEGSTPDCGDETGHGRSVGKYFGAEMLVPSTVRSWLATRPSSPGAPDAPAPCTMDVTVTAATDGELYVLDYADLRSCLAAYGLKVSMSSSGSVKVGLEGDAGSTTPVKKSPGAPRGRRNSMAGTRNSHGEDDMAATGVEECKSAPGSDEEEEEEEEDATGRRLQVSTSSTTMAQPPAVSSPSRPRTVRELLSPTSRARATSSPSAGTSTASTSTSAPSSSSSAPVFKLEDLTRLQTLGVGAFGRVFLVRHEPTGQPYALKEMNKARLIKCKQTKNVVSEKKVMEKLRHQFILKLAATFRDDTKLYMLTELVQGGELFSIMAREDRLNVAATRFYGSCVLVALEAIHNAGILYRDLKPENILIDDKGYCKLVDFGFAKQTAGRTYTLCGTPEYMAPELVLGKGYGQSADVWALGVLLYEMLVGRTPYADASGNGNKMVICQNIVRGDLRFPRDIYVADQDLTAARKVIRSLLNPNVVRRLGCQRNGASDVRNATFFKSVNWSGLHKRSVAAPWVPKLSNPFDSSHFDEQYDSEPSIGAKTAGGTTVAELNKLRQNAKLAPDWDKEFDTPAFVPKKSPKGKAVKTAAASTTAAPTVTTSAAPPRPPVTIKSPPACGSVSVAATSKLTRVAASTPATGRGQQDSVAKELEGVSGDTPSDGIRPPAPLRAGTSQSTATESELLSPPAVSNVKPPSCTKSPSAKPRRLVVDTAGAAAAAAGSGMIGPTTPYLPPPSVATGTGNSRQQQLRGGDSRRVLLSSAMSPSGSRVDALRRTGSARVLPSPAGSVAQEMLGGSTPMNADFGHPSGRQAPFSGMESPSSTAMFSPANSVMADLYGGSTPATARNVGEDGRYAPTDSASEAWSMGGMLSPGGVVVSGAAPAGTEVVPGQLPSPEPPLSPRVDSMLSPSSLSGHLYGGMTPMRAREALDHPEGRMNPLAGPEDDYVDGDEEVVDEKAGEEEDDGEDEDVGTVSVVTGGSDFGSSGPVGLMSPPNVTYGVTHLPRNIRRSQAEVAMAGPELDRLRQMAAGGSTGPASAGAAAGAAATPADRAVRLMLLTERTATKAKMTALSRGFYQWREQFRISRLLGNALALYTRTHVTSDAREEKAMPMEKRVEAETEDVEDEDRQDDASAFFDRRGSNISVVRRAPSSSSVNKNRNGLEYEFKGREREEEEAEEEEALDDAETFNAKRKSVGGGGRSRRNSAFDAAEGRRHKPPMAQPRVAVPKAVRRRSSGTARGMSKTSTNGGLKRVSSRSSAASGGSSSGHRNRRGSFHSYDKTGARRRSSTSSTGSGTFQPRIVRRGDKTVSVSGKRRPSMEQGQQDGNPVDTRALASAHKSIAMLEASVKDLETTMNHSDGTLTSCI